MSYQELVLKKHTQQNKPALPDHITRNEVNQVVQIQTQVDKNGLYWPHKIPLKEECLDDESSCKQKVSTEDFSYFLGVTQGFRVLLEVSHLTL